MIEIGKVVGVWFWKWWYSIQKRMNLYTLVLILTPFHTLYLHLVRDYTFFRISNDKFINVSKVYKKPPTPKSFHLKHESFDPPCTQAPPTPLGVNYAITRLRLIESRLRSQAFIGLFSSFLWEIISSRTSPLKPPWPGSIPLTFAGHRRRKVFVSAGPPGDKLQQWPPWPRSIVT